MTRWKCGCRTDLRRVCLGPGESSCGWGWPGALLCDDEELELEEAEILGEELAAGADGALLVADGLAGALGGGAAGAAGVAGAAVVAGCCANAADENRRNVATTRPETRITTSNVLRLGKRFDYSYGTSMLSRRKWISLPRGFF